MTGAWKHFYHEGVFLDAPRAEHNVVTGRRRCSRWLVAVATVVVRSASCDAVNDGTGVVLDMDADNFASACRSILVAVSFTASWCGHCKRLEPEWAKAAEILATHKNDPPIVLAQVDCTADKNAGLTKDLDITAFPTIIVSGTRATDVARSFTSRSRVADGIVDALRTLAAP